MKAEDRMIDLIDLS